MKIAITGKGGVGKSTVAAILAQLMAIGKKRVLAIDADPDANLAAALGIPTTLQHKIIPISKQAALIEERTGAKVNQYGQMFKLNPEVSDIADSFATEHRGVHLLVLGAANKGGGGCACPENVLIRALIRDLILYKDDVVIMDMEAGIEHLGRATAGGVDKMLIILEPGQRSVECAHRIMRMSKEIGLSQFLLLANKITHREDEDFIKASLPGNDQIIYIPFDENIRRADRDGKSALEALSVDVKKIFMSILSRLEEGD